MSKTEFRLYGNLNSSYFDLVSGKSEPQQTKGLGLLLSKSPLALEIFLHLLFPMQHIKKFLNMRCIVDCEARQKEESEDRKSKRADIIIRFFDGFMPHCAIVVEAKGWDKSAKEKQVLEQVINYCDKFKILKEFENKIIAVTLTANPILSSQDKFKNVEKIINITWKDLVNRLIKYNSAKNKFERELIEDYCNYLLNINGNMKFYEKEIISVPTAKTIEFVEDKDIAVYECPEGRPPYTALHRLSLFLAFRGEKGVVNKLYKISDKVVMRLDDNEAIDALDSICIGYASRLRKYLEKAKPDISEEKQIFFIDYEASITLRHPAIPGKQNNCYYPSYNIADFFRQPDDNGYVILPHK